MVIYWDLPSGKLTWRTGKLQFLLGKSTISMCHFQQLCNKLPEGKTYTLQLQTPSETVFDMFFWGVNTSSEGIWSTSDMYIHVSAYSDGQRLGDFDIL